MDKVIRSGVKTKVLMLSATPVNNRFIFTSPTFVKEKAEKQKREFYIPRLSRETSLYGTEFEIKLRNEMNQRAIASECADWIREKRNSSQILQVKTWVAL